MKMKTIIPIIGIFAVGAAFAEEQSNADIVKELSNPLAKIVNLPFQSLWEYGEGALDKGQHYTMQIMPVIPIELSKDYMLVSRSIFRLENKYDMGYENKFGLGDTSQTFWIAPTKNWNGWMGGIGPIFQLPTATEPELGSKQWGMGPSAIVVRQTHNWTYGLLLNQTWSVAGDDARPDLNFMYSQVFLSYRLPHAVTIVTGFDYTRDWNTDIELIPVTATVAKVVKIGKMPVSFSVGGKYYIETPDHGPNWGLRAGVTLVLPNLFNK